MQPEFGSGLQELLFDFNDDTLSGKIEDAITAALEQWLPYVTVEQIDVESTSNNRDNNLVNVSVTFGLLNQVDLNTVSFTIAA